MEHRDVQELLSAYIEGDLPADQKAAVEEHLAQCEECRRSLEELESMLAVVSSLPAKKAPDGFALAVQRRMRRQARRKRLATPDRLRHKIPYEIVALLMLMVILAIYIMVVYTNSLDGTIEPPPPQTHPKSEPSRPAPRPAHPDPSSRPAPRPAHPDPSSRPARTGDGD